MNNKNGTKIELWYETVDGRWRIMEGKIAPSVNGSYWRRLGRLEQTGHLMRFRSTVSTWTYRNGTESDWQKMYERAARG